MATITVLKFNTADGAEKALELIQKLTNQQLLTLQDAAIVTWPTGKKKPKTRQLSHLAGPGALDGALWGMLFGLIFYVPLSEMAAGAATGSPASSFTDIGLDDNFINSVRAQVTAGASALFLMTSEVALDKVTAAMKALDFELIASNLSREQEARLKAAFVCE